MNQRARIGLTLTRGLLTTLCLLLGFATPSAAAPILSLEFAGGATSLTTAPATGLTVDLFATLDADFGGQVFIGAGVVMDAGLTPTSCTDDPGPQLVGGGTWVPFVACFVPFDGNFHLTQDAFSTATPGTSGKLHMGTLTFDAPTPGTYSITPFYDPIIDGWIDPAFGVHVTGTFESAVVAVTPEPSAAVLFSLGFAVAGISVRNRRGTR